MLAPVRSPGRELQQLLGGVVPGDHAAQVLADAYIERGLGQSAEKPWRVLDLGCGSGSSVDAFRRRDPNVDWIGLDIADSPEPRTRTDARFEIFDGISIPFNEHSFDLVYCKQVLEHVAYPRPLLANVARVLAPGAYFAGSTSQLEPFHSFSMWNYTPLGFCALLQEAGLEPIEIRPGIDGFTLVSRRALGAAGPLERWWARWWAGESPVNRAIEVYGRLSKMDAQAVNANKLLFCGQFSFLARRPS